MSDKLNPAYTGGAVLFGILMSGVVSDALTGQPFWLRIGTTAIAAGILAAAFIFIANCFKRP